jgi:hypothetical protein
MKNKILTIIILLTIVVIAMLTKQLADEKQLKLMLLNKHYEKVSDVQKLAEIHAKEDLKNQNPKLYTYLDIENIDEETKKKFIIIQREVVRVSKDDFHIESIYIEEYNRAIKEELKK